MNRITWTPRLASSRGALRSGVELWRDRARRGVLLTSVSIPVNLILAGWKFWLFLATPSMFLLANVLFNIGVATVKGFAVQRHRSSEALPELDRIARHRNGFRWIGATIVVLSLGYATACLPMLFGSGHTATYDPQLAINIAAITFAEFGIAIWGAIAARKGREILIEGVKLTNVASAIVLMVLTQSALLSITDTTANAATYNAYSGLFLGSVSAVIGIAMLLRPFRQERSREQMLRRAQLEAQVAER